MTVEPAAAPTQVPGPTTWGQAQIFQFEEIPMEVSSRTFKRTAIRGDSSMATLNFFEPGNPPWPQHTHPFDQIAFVLSGQMSIELADETFEVTAPAAVWIPKDMPHCANIIGDQPCLNLDVFGVARQDFLHMTRYQGPWTTAEPAAVGTDQAPPE